MRQLPVQIAESALEDLWQIGSMLRVKGVSFHVVDAFVERITNKCLSIGALPEGYPRREDIGVGLRAAPFEHAALITYRVHVDFIEIVNVFYRGTDYGG